jgi:hypothetical protein
MSITYTRRRRDSREFTSAGSGVTYTRATGTRGPNLITDATSLGTLTNVADPAFLLVGNAAGTFARKLTHPSPSPAGTFNLASLTIDAFGRVLSASNGTVSAATITDSTATGRAVLTAADAAAARSAIGAGTGNALTSGTLAQFAATTSAELAVVLTDETGSGGGFVRATGPTLSGVTLSGETVLSVGGSTLHYNAFTDPSNNEFARHSWVANVYRLAIDKAGTGTYRNYAIWINNFAAFSLNSAFATFAVSVICEGVLRLGVGGDAGLNRAAPQVTRVGNSSGTGPGTFCSIPLTWTVAGTVNNAAPGVARRYRLSGSSTPIVTGISISQVDGQEFFICNPNATAVQFNHQDTNSTAANRIICTGAANITLAQDEEAAVWYDATTSRFRMRKL